MKCLRCGRGGFFRRINKDTGLCNECQSVSIKETKDEIIITDERLDKGNNTKKSNGLPRREIEALGFDLTDFDDFDRLDAESILKDREEIERKKDMIASLKHAQQEEKDSTDGLETVIDSSIAKKKRHTDTSVDDLIIKPDDYEEPNTDDDIPVLVPTKKECHSKTIGDEISEGDTPEYNYPPIDLLAQSETEDLNDRTSKDHENAMLLENTLRSFGIKVKLKDIAHGPVVTRYELELPSRVRINQISSLKNDIALRMASGSVEICAPVPGKSVVGIEVPNKKVETVYLRDVLESYDVCEHPGEIVVGLGQDLSGRYIVSDIAKLQNVLISGQPGSGKSVCISAIITSIMFRASPEEVRLILIDPKVVELSIYNDIPHLICPVVTDMKKAASALNWAVAEMTKRCKIFEHNKVKDIAEYNKALKPGEKAMPRIVIIINELADLMKASPNETEDCICSIAKMSRICGMHMVISTLYPSTQNVTGHIRSLIPSRIAFLTASSIESRMILGESGAEKLLGGGDMLFMPNGVNPMRVQGAWVSDEEVHDIVSYIKQSCEAVYDPDMLEYIKNAIKFDAEREEFEAEYDAKLAEAVSIAVELGQVSISMLQLKMRIGYARAGRLINDMAHRGIVSEADGSKPREVLITREQAKEMFIDWEH